MSAANQISVPLVGVGGTAPYTYTVVTGPNTNIPATIAGGMLTADASNLQPGIYSIEVQITDQAHNSSSKLIAVSVVAPDILTILNRDVSFEPSSFPFVGSIDLIATGASGDVVWSLIPLVTTLPNAVITGSILTFTLNSFGQWAVGIRATDSLGSTVTRVLTVSVQTASVVALVDGHAMIEVQGGTQQAGRTHGFTLTVNDVQNAAVSSTFNYRMDEPVSSVDLAETAVNYFWGQNDSAKIVFPISGNLSGFSIGSEQPIIASNGLTVTVDAADEAVVFSGPPTGWGNSEVAVPLAIMQGTSQVATILRQFTLVTHEADGSMTCTTRPYIVGDFVGLNPQRPYFNSPSIFKQNNYTAQLVTGNALPLGLSLDAVTGLIYGTVLAADVPKSILAYIDETGTVQATITIIWDIVQGQFALTDNLSIGQLQAPYSGTLTSSSSAPLTSAILHRGKLPTGLSFTISPDGTTVSLGGLPTVAGYFDLWIAVSNSLGQVGYLRKRLVIAYIDPLVVVTDLLQRLVTSQPFLQTLQAFGGVQPYTWSIASGTLPNGITLNPTSGVLAGTPSQTSYNQTITLQVTDQRGVYATLALPFGINNVLTIMTTTLPLIVPGTYYSYQLVAEGGQPAYMWSLSAGSPNLPGGLTLSPTGLLSGATSAGSYIQNVTFQVTDKASNIAAQPLTLQVGAANGMTIDTTGVGPLVRGSAYQGILKVDGPGVAPFTWSIGPNTPNALPNTLQLTRNAANNGLTATISGSIKSGLLNYAIEVQVVDANGNIASAFPMLNSFSNLTITTTSLPQATVSGTYSLALQCSGVNPRFTWSLDPSSPALPPGMSLTSTGTLYGPPTAAANVQLVFRVTDALGDYATATLNFVAKVSTLAITTTSLPSVTAGRGYSQLLAVTGGTPGYNWTLSPLSPAVLPTGLTLSASGVISGVSLQGGYSKSVLFRVTDTLGVYREVTLPMLVTVPVSLNTGPDYVQGTGTRSLGTVARGTVDSINPRRNLSFYVVGQQCLSTSPSGFQFALPAGFSAVVDGAVTNGFALFKLSGPFSSGAAGVNSFTFSISDSGVNVSANFTYTVTAPQSLALKTQDAVARPSFALLEGVAGSLWISNQSDTGYSFPPPAAGGSVNYSSVLGLFSIAGTNQMAISVAGSNTGYALNYSGAAIPAGLASNGITVTVEDMAWFNTAANTYDAFTLTSQGGGAAYGSAITWLTRPTVASVSPTSLVGDGAQKTITVMLTKPLTPAQQGVNAQFSVSGGGLTVLSSTPINNGGFITGWTVTLQSVIEASATTATLYLNANQPLTFLSGSSLVTQTVTYVSGAIANITVSQAPPRTVYPGVYLNAWGSGAPANTSVSHAGRYENGNSSYSTSLSVTNQKTSPYGNAQYITTNESDHSPTIPHYGNVPHAAVAWQQHGSGYLGCVWSFSNVAGHFYNAQLSVLSKVPADQENGDGWYVSGQGGAGVWVSFNGGNTWNMLYWASPGGQGSGWRGRPQQWDSINVPDGTPTGNVQVMAFAGSHDDMFHVIYEIHVNGIIA